MGTQPTNIHWPWFFRYSAMLKEASGIKRVILACGRTDLRHGIDWLSAMVRLSYRLDPLEEGTLFLFCGVRKDRLKGLIFEGTGFCLFTLRLTDGRFQWPGTPDEARDITLEQFRRLLDGFAIDASIRRFHRMPEQARKEAAKPLARPCSGHLPSTLRF